MNIKQISESLLWMKESMNNTLFGEISLRLVIHNGEVVRIIRGIETSEKRISDMQAPSCKKEQ